MESSAPAAGPETPAAEQKDALPASYAWRRYFARMFDLSIVTGLIFFLLGMLSVVVVAVTDHNDLQAYIVSLRGLGQINRFLDSIMTALLWIPFEALLLYLFGATPGKWIFGLRVRMQAERSLRFKTAISRAGLVPIVGQALTVPLISLITLFVSYDRLTKTGVAYWDKELGTTVDYAKLSDARIVLCVIAAALWAFISLLSLIRSFAA